MNRYHRAISFYNLKDYLADHIGDPAQVGNWSKRSYDELVRFWTIRWNRATKNGRNLPLISQCPCCSGKERKDAIKNGEWKVSTREDQKRARGEEV